VYTDIDGKARTPGSHFDLGAYVYSTGSTGGGEALATLNPEADTYVNNTTSGSNYGSSTPLRISGSGHVQTAYLKFDLLSLAGKTVSSAKLRLWVYNGASGTYSVNSVADTSWTESGTTYVNRPSVGSAITSVTSPANDIWIEFDVTAQVKASLGELISFAMTSTSSHTLLLDSREVKYNKPQLVIK
jgi:hypothetical protein